MGGSQYIPSFSLSTFAQAVSSPYTSLAAYRSGVIDERGNLLKPESSIDDFEYFIIKLKKIFDQVPMSYTRSALDSYATTFKMFTEEAEQHGLKPYEFMFFVEGYLTTLLTEDMTTGSAPGTLGTPAQSTSEGGVMGYEKILGAPPAPFMGGMQMFDVSKEELENFKTHKAWKHIPDSETKKYLQRFQRRNKDSKIAMRALDPETGKYEVHWVKIKPMSFMEEFNLDFLINESTKDGKVNQYNDANENPDEIKQATLTDNEEKKASSDSPGAYAVDAIVRHLTTLGGHSVPETNEYHEPIRHLKTGKPLKSYTRIPYFVEHPETKQKIKNTEELKPGQFRVGPGGKGSLDLEIRDWDPEDANVKGYHGSIEIKSMTKKPRFNIDVSDTAAPKSQSSYMAVAAGLGLNPEEMKKWSDISPGKVFDEVRRMASPDVQRQARSKQIKDLKSYRIKPLAGVAGRRVAKAIKNAFTRSVGREKGGLLFGVNADSPETDLHVIDMNPHKTESEKQSVQHLLDNLGGLEITANFGGPELVLDPKVTKSKAGRMIRIDTREAKGKDTTEEMNRKKRSNAQKAFDRHNRYYKSRTRSSLSKEEINQIMGN